MGKADWDLEADYGPWVQEVRRILKVGGTAYAFGLPEAIAAHWATFPDPKRWLTWTVTNRVSPGAKSWQPSQEAIAMFWKGKSPFFDRDAVREPYSAAYARLKGKPRPKTAGRFGSAPSRYGASSGALPRSVLTGPGLSGGIGAREGLAHPCQKPLWLPERLIKASCPPDGLVLDLFAGTATTSVAAHRQGRHWIAVEQDTKWCEVARERLRDEGAPAQIAVNPGPKDWADLMAWKAAIESNLKEIQSALTRLEHRRENRRETTSDSI